jgi:hypothetical protein
MDPYSLVELWEMLEHYINKKEKIAAAEQFVTWLEEKDLPESIIEELREISTNIDAVYQDISDNEDDDDWDDYEGI